MRFSLVGSHNLAHGYLGAAQALRRAGHEVDFIPGAIFKTDYQEKCVSKLIQALQEQDTDVVLWWRAEHLSSDELSAIRKILFNKKFIMFSWDDPYQWERHLDMPTKCKNFDMAFTCCADSVNDYNVNGCKAVYSLPGFDPEVHFPELDEKYKCDISIVCTNLYHGNTITQYPHISRLNLLSGLINMFPELDIRIYGPEEMNLFGDRYKGWIAFEESRKVFYNSKINLDTHIRPDGYMYLNERVGQVLGSGGLLFVDKVRGIENILKHEEECVVMALESKDLFKSQIENVLKHQEKYDIIRQNGLKKALKEFTWDNWASIILSAL